MVFSMLGAVARRDALFIMGGIDIVMSFPFVFHFPDCVLQE